MTAESRAERRRSSAILVYMLLFVSLQIFLLVVALEGVASHEPGLARAAAALSVAVFISALALRWFLRDD